LDDIPFTEHLLFKFADTPGLDSIPTGVPSTGGYVLKADDVDELGRAFYQISPDPKATENAFGPRGFWVDDTVMIKHPKVKLHGKWLDPKPFRAIFVMADISMSVINHYNQVCLLFRCFLPKSYEQINQSVTINSFIITVTFRV